MGFGVSNEEIQGMSLDFRFMDNRNQSIIVLEQK